MKKLSEILIGLNLLLVGAALGLALWKKDPSDDFDPKLTFVDYCENADEYTTAIQESVKTLQAFAGGDDCQEAWKRLQTVNALELSGRQLASVAPLAHMTQLIYLNLRMNQIHDVRPLGQLVGLRTLKLESNRIQDVSPLRHLIKLESLDLTGNPVRELEVLESFKELRILRLDNSQVEDISPLRGLGKLKEYDFFRGLTLNNTPAMRQDLASSSACRDPKPESAALQSLCTSAKM